MMNSRITEILAEMMDLNHHDFNEFKKGYEPLFKELAMITQGSLLWNENPEIDEEIPETMELKKCQSEWLKEIGLEDVAKRWLEF